MGSVFKKTYTKPLPSEAELFEKSGKPFARVKPAKGRAVTYPVTLGKDGSQRIVVEAATYLAKYRDGQGIVCEVSTGCRDEAAARCVLNELERRSELVRAGVLSSHEDRTADHQRSPVSEHFDAYLTSMIVSGKSAYHIRDTKRLAKRVFENCSMKTLRDIDAVMLEDWLAARLNEGMAARTRNRYLQAVNGFCGWCVRNGRLSSNPVACIAKADEKCDRRKVRRALSEDELRRLLHVVRWRPLAEYGRETEHKEAEHVARKRDTWKAAPLTFETLDAAVERARERLACNLKLIEQLEHRGRERQLIIKTLVTTGLRKGELASVRLRNLNLDDERPSLTLEAKNEKNRQGNTLPLRADLAAELREWLIDRATKRRLDAANAPTIKFDRKAGSDPRSRANKEQGRWLMPDELLFDVPDGLVKILDRDLQAAGISKRDDRGRTLDVHALRTTFGTHLSKAGVSLRTAQAAMRHSDPKLTANIYTDPRLLDVHGAVEALPTLSLSSTQTEAATVMKATGTTTADSSNAPAQLAPMLAPTSRKPCHFMACIGTETERNSNSGQTGENVKNKLVSACFASESESGAAGIRTQNQRIMSPLL